MWRLTLLGLLTGTCLSLLDLLGTLTALPHRAWDLSRSVVYFLLLAGLGLVAWRRGRAQEKLGRIVQEAALASLLAVGLPLVAYWISTAYFPEQLRQLPYFAKDAGYHGFGSPQEYLSSGNNYRELMKLQFFSAGIAALFQIGLATAVGWAARLVARLRLAASSGTSG